MNTLNWCCSQSFGNLGAFYTSDVLDVEVYAQRKFCHAQIIAVKRMARKSWGSSKKVHCL